ncbi:MAG: hypothetical protein WCJ35_05660 [Planctomycetota bacterium]
MECHVRPGPVKPCLEHSLAQAAAIRPLGASVRAHICYQVNNGIAAQMVLYHYDFNDPAVGNPAKLSPYGLRRLSEIAKWIQAGNVCPVMIEHTLGSPALDTARQMHVATVLGELSLAPQVVIADTPAGLRGDEALLIHQNLLQQTSAGGTTFARQSISGTGPSNEQSIQSQ